MILKRKEEEVFEGQPAVKLSEEQQRIITHSCWTPTTRPTMTPTPDFSQFRVCELEWRGGFQHGTWGGLEAACPLTLGRTALL